MSVSKNLEIRRINNKEEEEEEGYSVIYKELR
jgi:hypothetical protein